MKAFKNAVGHMQVVHMMHCTSGNLLLASLKLPRFARVRFAQIMPFFIDNSLYSLFMHFYRRREVLHVL
jgi:hypothetical protein